METDFVLLYTANVLSRQPGPTLVPGIFILFPISSPFLINSLQKNTISHQSSPWGQVIITEIVVAMARDN